MYVILRFKINHSEIIWFVDIVYFKVLCMILSIGSALLIVLFFKHLYKSCEKPKQIFNPVGGGENFANLMDLYETYMVIDSVLKNQILEIIDLEEYDKEFPLIISIELLIYIFRIQPLGKAVDSLFLEKLIPASWKLEINRMFSVYIPDKSNLILPSTVSFIAALGSGGAALFMKASSLTIVGCATFSGVAGFFGGDYSYREIRRKKFLKSFQKLLRFSKKDQISINLRYYTYLPEGTSLDLVSPEQQAILRNFYLKKEPNFKIPHTHELVLAEGTRNATYWMDTDDGEHTICKGLATGPTKKIQIPEKNYKNLSHVSRHDSTEKRNIGQPALELYQKYYQKQEAKSIQKLKADLLRTSKLLNKLDKQIHPTPEQVSKIGRYGKTSLGRKKAGYKKFNKALQSLRDNLLGLPPTTDEFVNGDLNALFNSGVVDVDVVIAARGGFCHNNYQSGLRWKKIEEKIVLTMGFIALSLSKLSLNSNRISDSKIDNYIIEKPTNENIVRLQKQMIFENFDLEKTSGKKKYQNRIVIQIGSIQIHEKLSEEKQKKMLKMLEQDLHYTSKINKSLNQRNVNSKLAHKTKRTRMKTINDLPPLNFKDADVIKTVYDTNTVKIKTKIQ